MRGLLVKGPCTVKSEGKASVIGVEFEEITLPEGTYTICYEGNLSHNCEVIPSEPQCWDEIAREIASTSGKYLIVGPADTGKSYFSRTLVNLKAAETLVDADVGQNSLFLPGFIASASTKKLRPFRFHQLAFDRLKFFGSITPSSNPKLHIEQVASLVAKNSIVDLDGWTHGFMAFRHKIELIELVDPDYIITTSREIARSLRALGKRFVELKQPEGITKRDRERRRAFRASAYRAYFMESRQVAVSPEAIMGTRVAESLFEALGETVETSDECLANFSFVPDRVYVGLTLKGEVIGAGLLSLKGEELSVETPVEKFDGILLGSFRLNEFYEEQPVTLRRCKG